MSLFDALSKLDKIIGPIIFPSSYDGWVAIHIFRSAGDNTDLSELKSRMSDEVASLRRRRRFCLIVTFPVFPSTQYDGGGHDPVIVTSPGVGIVGRFPDPWLLV